MTFLQLTARSAALIALIAALVFVPAARAMADSPCLAAIKETGKAMSYRIVMQIPASKITMKAEVQRPSAIHVVETISGQTIEIVAIGKKNWMRTNGVWKANVGIDTASFLAMNPLSFSDFKEQTCAAAGTASFGGSPVRVYHATWTSPKGPAADTIYLDNQGRIVHMVETSGKQAGSTTDVYNYGSVTVTAP